MSWTFLLFRVESHVILLSRSLKRLRYAVLDSRVVILLFICSFLSRSWILLSHGHCSQGCLNLDSPKMFFLFCIKSSRTAFLNKCSNTWLECCHQCTPETSWMVCVHCADLSTAPLFGSVSVRLLPFVWRGPHLFHSSWSGYSRCPPQSHLCTSPDPWAVIGSWPSPRQSSMHFFDHVNANSAPHSFSIPSWRPSINSGPWASHISYPPDCSW